MGATRNVLLIFLTAAILAAAASAQTLVHTYPPSLFATILSALGFRDLSNVTANASLSLTAPSTVFAPTDSSLLTCPSCSLPLLLQEHSLPGLYSFHFLRNLAFGTKIETFARNRCLTITASPIINPSDAVSTRKIFVNGVEITKPDLFDNGLVIVHGIQGFMSHLSPTSCTIEKMTTLAYPDPPPPTAEFLVMRSMLKEAMAELRVRGFSLVALAMRVKYPELADLKSMTLFAIDDGSIFAGGGGHAYVTDLMFHIVPNRILKGSHLMSLPLDTVIPTMERGQELVVTTAGGGGPLSPMRINYMKIKSLDLVSNKRIVVHALSNPLPHVHRRTAIREEEATCDEHQSGLCEESAGTKRPTVQIEDPFGL
ncbi:unnamed protein product [Coffea canephora]|uniref:FAS1 domain-containing protein n=2 Tax=Coffea TaxID=13442 RepID=A0A068U502_COFCA|nr:uncharacterized protein LOC113733385 [Coffea arabica]CDP03640.1 unnamed protein product [Coffea canephora]